MSTSVSFKKIVQSAIVIAPPEALWGPIQEIRKVHDKAYPRWMPHVNLIYPFVPLENFGDVVQQAKQALMTLAPFKLSLNKFGYFTHKSDVAMWLDPECDPKGSVHQVQAALEKAFPYCNDISQISDSGFNPHLSVGQFPKNEAKTAMKKLQDQWVPIEFIVKEVYMINRSDFESPFKVYYRVPLGNDSVEEVNPIPAKLQSSKPSPSTTSYVAFIGNLPFSATESDLQEAFAVHQLETVSVIVPRQQGTGKPKGFAFVEFSSTADLDKALSMDKQITLAGRTLNVQRKTS